MQRLVLIMVFAGTLAMPLLSSAREEGKLTVTVRIYNYAGIEHTILKGAQRGAARILNRAGAGTGWIECPESPEEAGSEPACAKPQAGHELILKLLPEAMARKLKRTDETFGFAVPTSTAGLGTAFVFVKQAEQLAFYGPFPLGYDVARAVVLG
ncbi:MAG: hypothetical protein GY953_08295, partial [bacterium]|nr:hypothetical protein [bacterium]